MRRRHPRGRWWRLTWAETACFALGAIFMGVAVGAAMAAADGRPPDRLSANQIEVAGPDTLRIVTTGEWVRLADLSTPALPPEARCAWEARLALAAKARLQDLVAGARRIELAEAVAGAPATDSEGRLLRDLYVDGANVAALLREDGLAHSMNAGAVDWCRR